MSDSDTHTIAMIGAGNMARALMGGLIARGHPRDRLVAADPDDATRNAIERDYGVVTRSTNAEAVAGADVVVLAVKPQVIDQVTASIATGLIPRSTSPFASCATILSRRRLRT